MTSWILIGLLAGPIVVKDDVAALDQQWAKDWSAKNLEAVMKQYTADATFLPVGAPKVTGRDAIRAFFKTILATNTADLTLHSTAKAASGDLAYDLGEYDETVKNPAGTQKFHGSYLTVFKRVEGTWLIAAQSWTEAK
jgi:uncharacterized protein (TIGR02246 family)